MAARCIAPRDLPRPFGTEVLDHFVDEATLGEVVDRLDDPDETVRWWALHTLGCDRCKEGTCRPGGEVVVEAAERLLADDPADRVRTLAAEVIERVTARSA